MHFVLHTILLRSVVISHVDVLYISIHLFSSSFFFHFCFGFELTWTRTKSKSQRRRKMIRLAQFSSGVHVHTAHSTFDKQAVGVLCLNPSKSLHLFFLGWDICLPQMRNIAHFHTMHYTLNGYIKVLRFRFILMVVVTSSCAPLFLRRIQWISGASSPCCISNF